MPSPTQEIISWVIEELSVAGIEGIPISNLFDHANSKLSSISASTLNAATKEIVWKSLIKREDIQVLDSGVESLKSSSYQDAFGTSLGTTKISLRPRIQLSAPKGSSTVVEKSNPDTITAALSPKSQLRSVSVLPSIESNLFLPDDPTSSEARPATRQSERFSVQRTESPAATPTSKNKGPQRKTSRRWTYKTHHVTQDEVEKEENDRQYAAGLARVYIDPPGSARSTIPPMSQLVDESTPARSRTKKVKQKIAVFKSLCLTDPLWLLKKKGSWKEAFSQRAGDLPSHQLPDTNFSHPEAALTNTPTTATQLGINALPAEPILKELGELSRHENTNAMEGNPILNELVLIEPDSQSNQAEDTISVKAPIPLIELSSRKRKGQINEGEPPRKRGRPRKAVSAMVTPQLDKAVSPPPVADARPSEAEPLRRGGRTRKATGAISTREQPETTAPTLPTSSQVQAELTKTSSPSRRAARTTVTSQPTDEAPTSTTPASATHHERSPTHKKTPHSREASSIIAVSQPHEADQPTLLIPTDVDNGASDIRQPLQSSPLVGQTNTIPQRNFMSRLASKQPTAYKSPYSSYEDNQAITANDEHFVEPKTAQSLPNSTAFEHITSVTQTSVRSADSNGEPLQPARSEVPEPLLHVQNNSTPGETQHVPGPLPQSFRGQQNLQPDTIGPESEFGPHGVVHYATNVQGNFYTPSPNHFMPDYHEYPQQFQTKMFFPPQPQDCSRGLSFSDDMHQSTINPTTFSQSGPSTNNRNRTEEQCSKFVETVERNQPLAPILPTQPKNDIPYKPKHIAEMEAMEATLSQVSEKARAIEIPDTANRLLAFYDKIAGNLLLSSDKAHLTFRTLDQVGDPILDFEVVQISQDPIVSMKGSRPMELQVNYTNDNDDINQCRFFIGQSTAAYQNANVMRAAIVTARIKCLAAKHDMNPQDLLRQGTIPNLDVVKPFKCDTCAKRFKNREGIKYHLEKSNTICNPNFVPSTEPPKPKRGSKPKRGPKCKKPPKTASTKPARKKAKSVATVEDETAQDHGSLRTLITEEGDSSDSFHDSDDSVFEWAEKVAFGEAARSAPTRRTKSLPKRPRATAQPLVLERDLLQVLVDEAINETSSHETIHTAAENVLRELVEEVVACRVLEEQCSRPISQAEASKSSNQISHHRSRGIILNLINRNYGIFPGGQSFWIAFVTSWLQNHPRSLDTPNPNMFKKALEELLQEQNLISTDFPMLENDSMSPSFTIISTPTTELISTPIETVKELIKLAHPRCYVPSRFAPSTQIRERLENYANEFFREPTQNLKGYSNPCIRIRENGTNESDYEDSFDEISILSEDIRNSEDSETDSSYSVEILRNSSFGQKPTDKAKSHRTAVKANSTSIDMAGSASTSPTPQAAVGNFNQGRSQLGLPKADPRAWKGSPVPLQEKERRKLIKANILMNYAPTSLQNTETSTWNEVPYRVAYPERSKPPSRRYRHPEVITYLQSENGAWTSRAYGHGSTPIFTRPLRRADGNPSLGSYIRRIEEGHRPVIVPSQKNRQFLPAVPSKLLLGTGKFRVPRKQRRESGEGEDEETKEPKTKKYAITPMDGCEPLQTKLAYKRKASTTSIEAVHPTSEQVLEKSVPKEPKRARLILNVKKRPIPEEADSDYEPDVEPTYTARRVTRNAARGEKGLDMIQKLCVFYPREYAEFMKSPNPGLVTLPLNFWVGRSGSGVLKQPGVVPRPPGLLGIEQMAQWERSIAGQKVISDRSSSSAYLWVNHTVDARESTFATEMIRLRWEPSATFGIENLPYEALIDSENEEDLKTGALTQTRLPALKKQRRSRPKKFRTRRLIAWSTDFDGVVEDLETIREKFDVVVAPKLHVGQGRTFDRTITDQEENRLMIAVIVISTLTGGVRKTPDWVLIANTFPSYSLNYIARTWRRILKTSKALVEAMTADFQMEFLSAYEAGELPEIDYENLVDYDWLKVVDWAVNNINMQRIRDNSLLLPNSRKEMKQIWDMTEQDSGADKARDMWFNPRTANYKRMEASSALARTYPIESVSRPRVAEDIEIDDITLARSWIKSLILTPEADWDKDVARTKLVQLGDELCEEVREALVAEKVMKGAHKHAGPGRAYKPADAFFFSLRKRSSEDLCVQAMEFKNYLDVEFASGKQCVRHDYLANEGTILCVTNLQAHARVRLEGVNVPLNKMGYTGGGYETRKIAKETFTFAIDIYPTNLYTYNEDIAPLHIMEFLEPPRGGSAGETPVWYGVTNKLIPGVWKEVLVALSSTSAKLASSSVSVLEKTFRPALEEWEIWRFMEWGVNVGLVERIDESIEGWTMGEWWWAVVGNYCLTTSATNDEQ